MHRHNGHDFLLGEICPYCLLDTLQTELEDSICHCDCDCTASELECPRCYILRSYFNEEPTKP